MRSLGQDPRGSLTIDLGIGLDPANDIRTAEDGRDPVNMKKVDGSIESPKVGMKRKTRITTIEGQGKGTPVSTPKDQP